MLLRSGLFCLIAAFTLPFPASANAEEQADTRLEEFREADINNKSDEELTALTARWGELSPSQRRVLLAEVRARMADRKAAHRAARGAGSAEAAMGQMGLVVQRRYGRVVRQSDGSVVMETRVIRMSPSGQGTRRGSVTFGFGFERRAHAHGSPPGAAAEPSTEMAGDSSHDPAQDASEATPPPVMTVSQPDRD